MHRAGETPTPDRSSSGCPGPTAPRSPGSSMPTSNGRRGARSTPPHSASRERPRWQRAYSARSPARPGCGRRCCRGFGRRHGFAAASSSRSSRRAWAPSPGRTRWRPTTTRWSRASCPPRACRTPCSMRSARSWAGAARRFGGLARCRPPAGWPLLLPPRPSSPDGTRRCRGRGVRGACRATGRGVGRGGPPVPRRSLNVSSRRPRRPPGHARATHQPLPLRPPVREPATGRAPRPHSASRPRAARTRGHGFAGVAARPGALVGRRRAGRAAGARADRVGATLSGPCGVLRRTAEGRRAARAASPRSQGP